MVVRTFKSLKKKIIEVCSKALGKKKATESSNAGTPFDERAFQEANIKKPTCPCGGYNGGGVNIRRM